MHCIAMSIAIALLILSSQLGSFLSRRVSWCQCERVLVCCLCLPIIIIVVVLKHRIVVHPSKTINTSLGNIPKRKSEIRSPTSKSVELRLRMFRKSTTVFKVSCLSIHFVDSGRAVVFFGGDISFYEGNGIAEVCVVCDSCGGGGIVISTMFWCLKFGNNEGYTDIDHDDIHLKGSLWNVWNQLGILNVKARANFRLSGS